MTTEQLEQRVAALEQTVADLQQKISTNPQSGKWWERIVRPMSPKEQEAFERMIQFGRYFRKTGREAPPEWQPGDPIPETHETQQ
jgi:Ni/Co efflux regulator RcnB